MALVIWLLARLLRQDDRRDDSGGRAPQLSDRLLAWSGKALGLIIDVLFWPLQVAFVGVQWLIRQTRRATGRPAETPILLPRARERAGIVGRLLVLLPFMIFVIFPFYWIIITSLKSTPQISERRSIYWPQPAPLEQYQTLLTGTRFLSWLRNSVLVAAASTLISVALASLAAYALSRLRFTGAGLLTTLLLVTYLLPGTLLFIPLYQTLTPLGLVNSYGALITTYPTFLLPFATWVMLGYFRSIPVELEEAAMIDGASRLYTFWKITLPLAATALQSVTLIAFVFITSVSLRTLPIGLQAMVVGDFLPWGQLMAASLLTAVPVAALYIYAQRYLVEGLTVGGVK